MTTSNLPPLRHLPNWSGMGSLDRFRYPRLFPRDCGGPHKAAQARAHAHEEHQSARAPVDQKRAVCMEKDILFLQESHKQTLEKLHEEIESLRRANKDLQYRLIMESHSPPPKGSSAGNLHEKSSQTGVYSLEEKFEISGQGWAIITSLLPLKIHIGQSRLSRTPTLQECEHIIQQLYRANTLQSQELLQMKAILRDIVLNKKITPEVYTQTKEHLINTNSKGYVEHLPKLPLRIMPKTQHISPGGMREKVILPAIGKNLNSSITARQKRAQDVHKSRLRRAVNS